MTKLVIDNLEYCFDLSAPIDISIPLIFNGSQPNAYGVEPATSTPCAAGELVGDTRQGGSCNFEQYTFIPHCNGTHTECVGHITNERISVRDSLRDVFIEAELVTVTSVRAINSGDTYSTAFGEDDLLIEKKSLEDVGDAKALIVRTLPNDDSKLSREYIESVPPYFTTEAMQGILELGVEHLLVDLPSIDRLFDDGRLSNHRIFWDVDAGSFEPNLNTRRHSTITELVYVPNEVPDGRYLLNLQVAPFATDAAPSRPILFSTLDN